MVTHLSAASWQPPVLSERGNWALQHGLVRCNSLGGSLISEGGTSVNFLIAYDTLSVVVYFRTTYFLD